jgi:anti-sigma regulatory factor (Ser/Thr protein kinase)
MNESSSQARLAAVLQYARCGTAVLASDGALVIADARGRALAESLDASGAVRTASPGQVEIDLAGARLTAFGPDGEWILHEFDDAEEREEAARRQFLSDVLNAATQGKLRLSYGPSDLPPRLPTWNEIALRQDLPLAPLRDAVRRAARAAGLSEERTFGAALAAGELAMNAVQHGGGGVARVGAHAGDEGTVQVMVEDHGPGIALHEIPRSALVAGYSTKNSMGMGFFLALQETDRLFLRTGTGGTTVVIEVDHQPTPPLWLQRAGAGAGESLSDLSLA